MTVTKKMLCYHNSGSSFFWLCSVLARWSAAFFSRSTALSSSRMAFMSMYFTFFTAVSLEISRSHALGVISLAAFFQFFQIPGGGLIQKQFPAVALLEQFPLGRFYLVKLLADGLVLAVLFPHLAALGQSSNPALGPDDLTPQVIVPGVQVGDFSHGAAAWNGCRWRSGS